MDTQNNTTEVPGVIMYGGEEFMKDGNGRLVPLSMVKPQHKLEDEAVRKIIDFARDLSDQIARFKGHTFENLSEFDELLAQQYGAKKGGTKGNKTYYSVDRTLKVQVQMADQIDFGPELQVAKALVDECLIDWADEGRDEIKVIVLSAFNVENSGQINKAELFKLLRLEIDDERWMRGMDAIRDAIRIVGSKMYFRFYQRPDCTAAWETITIDLAKAKS